MNCLVLLHELLNGYLNQEGNFAVHVPEAVPQMPSPTEKNQMFKSEQSSDDLRTGLFQYIRDAGKYIMRERVLTAHSLSNTARSLEKVL